MIAPQTPASDATNQPTPEYREAQRQCALSALAALQQALRCGQLTTAQAQAARIDGFLQSMAAGAGR